MGPSNPYGWVAVLTLALGSAVSTSFAQSGDTLSISGTFRMGALNGTVGADLVGVFARDNEHWWRLTMVEPTAE